MNVNRLISEIESYEGRIFIEVNDVVYDIERITDDSQGVYIIAKTSDRDYR
jgi:hypothetical protein